MKFNYRWSLQNANFTKDKGVVFSCFSCGGGSTMGYKLAGYDVIGCNEIDYHMMDVYIKNHNPKFPFLMPIQEFKQLKDLPDELFNLDILDGSPPCSSFSMNGTREKHWGVEKMFKEGQAKQVIDTLFFDFIDLAKRLQPKVVIAENVEGLLFGNAKNYVKRIHNEFNRAGYSCVHYRLDASKMGVPQKRKRVFFIALRNDLICKVPRMNGLDGAISILDLNFNMPEIPLAVMDSSLKDRKLVSAGNDRHVLAGRRPYGYANTDASFTLTANGNRVNYFSDIVDGKFVDGKKFDDLQNCLISSFPTDFDFLKMKSQYIVGMSVPPLMTANVADRIYEQWLSKIK